MSKQQRTVHLPEELYQFADAFESLTGARFNRQVLAAMIQFFCAEPWPDNFWITQAVEVERGNIEIAETMMLYAEHQRDEAQATIETLQGLVNDGERAKEDLLPYYHLIRVAYNKWARVIQIMKSADEPLEAIVKHWKNLDRTAQIPSVVTPETHPNLFKTDAEGRQTVNWQHNDPAPPDAEPDADDKETKS